MVSTGWIMRPPPRASSLGARCFVATSKATTFAEFIGARPRVGALVVRDGGESDDPERRATTVLLDAGGPATPPEEMDRAVEVAASVLSSAAHPSRTGVSGAYRLVTTAGWDSGAQHRDDGLEDTLVALAALGPAPFPAWNASQRRSAGSGERTETSCFLWSAPSGNLLQIAPFLNTSPGGTPAS